MKNFTEEIGQILARYNFPVAETKVLLGQVDRMTLPEVTQFLAIIQELGQKGQSEIFNQILGKIYRDVPVDAETFFTHDDYFGKHGRDLFPKLMDDLIRLFEGDYTEVVLAGAIGWGKTFLVPYIIGRILYEVSCLIDPQAAYDQAPGSRLLFPNISITLTQAKNVIFGKMKYALTTSPYFREQFPFEPYAEYLLFPNNIELRAVTTSGILGEDVFAAAMDEVNFMETVEKSKQAHGIKYDAAQVIYESLARRMESRFIEKGRVPGKIIMMSSTLYPDEFTDRKKKEALTNPLIFVLDYPTWGTRPLDKYMKKRFWVSMGLENEPPKLLVDRSIADQYRGKDIEVLEIPLDFYPQFKTDIEGSLRDIAGKTKLLVERFITQTDKIYEAADTQRRHPFSLEETTLKDGGKFIRDLLAHQIPGSDGNLVWRPAVSSYTRRFCHIDLARTGNAAGFCVGHPRGEIQVTRRDEKLELYTESMPIVYIDVMLRIVAPEGEEINFGNIRSLIYELQGMGYLFEKVTLDSYQSSDTIQILNNRGIKAEELSLETSLDPYNELKTALYEDRLQMYWYDIVLEEMKYLKREETTSQIKVVKLAGRSKDVADCLAGVVYNCVEWMRNPKRLPPPPPGPGYMEGDTVEDEDAKDLGEDEWIDE